MAAAHALCTWPTTREEEATHAPNRRLCVVRSRVGGRVLTNVRAERRTKTRSDTDRNRRLRLYGYIGRADGSASRASGETAILCRRDPGRSRTGWTLPGRSARS